VAVSQYVKNNTSGLITLLVGATTLDLAYDQGNFQLTGIAAVLNERLPVERRGRFVNLVHGNRTYPQLTFNCWLTQFAEASAPGDAIDWILHKDAYSAITPTWGAGLPWASDLRYTMEGTDFGDASDHTFTCHDVDYSADISEGADGVQLSITGTVYGEIDGDIDVAGLS
jgi:hypothetical protein